MVRDGAKEEVALPDWRGGRCAPGLDFVAAGVCISFSPMFPRALSFVAALALAPLSAVLAQAPAYQNDFSQDAVGKPPAGAMVMAGAFAVKEEGGEKFLELPGAPLDTFGLMFGPSQPAGGSVAARIFGTKQGRKFPAFAVSLGGVGGYKLQVSAAKKTVELFKRDESLASVPYTWESGGWTALKLQTRQAGAGWMVEGKVWPHGQAEPKEWTISLEVKDAPAAGRPAVWGSPYAGTPIRFDDLVLMAPAQ